MQRYREVTAKLLSITHQNVQAITIYRLKEKQVGQENRLAEQIG
jgi:hypothetical protein